jgi:hypothetical protein
MKFKHKNQLIVISSGEIFILADDGGAIKSSLYDHSLNILQAM